MKTASEIEQDKNHITAEEYTRGVNELFNALNRGNVTIQPNMNDKPVQREPDKHIRHKDLLHGGESKNTRILDPETGELIPSTKKKKKSAWIILTNLEIRL